LPERNYANDCQVVSVAKEDQLLIEL
jgi:hypothetical protein